MPATRPGRCPAPGVRPGGARTWAAPDSLLPAGRAAPARVQRRCHRANPVASTTSLDATDDSSARHARPQGDIDAKKLDAASSMSLARLSSLTSRSSGLIRPTSSVLTRPLTGVDCGLLAPPPQRVGGGSDPSADPQHGGVERQARLLRPGLGHEPLRPITQLVRVLPRCWHSTLTRGFAPATRPGFLCVLSSGRRLAAGGSGK